MRPRLHVLIVILMLLPACGLVRQLRQDQVVLDADEIGEVSRTAYEQIKSKTPISTDFDGQSGVRCISTLLIAELPDESQEWSWDSVVFDDPEIDSFGLPGGLLGINSGMLSYADGEPAVAAVLAHELAHVLLNQAGKRVSAAYTFESAIAAAQTFRGTQGPPASIKLYALLGLGTRVGKPLAYADADESAALLPGLELLARAGYDPAQALQLWEKLQSSATDSQAAWLSQHGDPARLVSRTKAAMPELQRIHQAAHSAGKTPACMNASD